MQSYHFHLALLKDIFIDVQSYHFLLALLKDVFIVDGVEKCFVWIGKDASEMEKKQAMSYAHVSKQ